MRKKTVALLALTAAAAAGLAVGGLGAAPPREDPPAAETALSRVDVSRARWRLGGYEGRLALYRAASAEPEIVFSVWLSSLPQADQERLEAGIELADDEALVTLLEDFTS